MLTSNHRKLLSREVNACYPLSTRNKEFDGPVSPDQNSLSKLIYYCSTRPQKLKKVSNYLLTYARSQSLPHSLTSSLSIYRHSKPGLICTIRLFKSLIENCDKNQINLQSIYLDVMTMVATGLGLLDPLRSSHTSTRNINNLQSKDRTLDHGYFGTGWTSMDYEINLESIDLFSCFTRILRTDSLQDDDVARNYLFFLAKFASVAMFTPTTLSISQSLEHQGVGEGGDVEKLKTPAKSARCLALVALHSSAQSSGLCSTVHFNKQIRLIIPGLIATISPSLPHRDPDTLLEIIQKISNQDSDKRIESVKEDFILDLNQTRNSIIDSLKLDSKWRSTESDLISYSIKILQLLLNSQIKSFGHFETCIVVIFGRLESVIKLENRSQWYGWLGRKIFDWSTVKYRSIVIDVILDRLTLIISSQYQLAKPEEKKPVLRLLHQKSMILLQILIAILKDPILEPIESLNVMKILNQLVHLLQMIIISGDQTDLFKELRCSLVEAIGGLALKVYYDEQINDMCRELLDRVKLISHPLTSTLSKESQNETSPCNSNLLVSLMNCLDLILINSHQKLVSIPAIGSEKASQAISNVLLTQWKDVLLILKDVKDRNGRLAILRAISSFIDLKAFECFKEQKDWPDRLDQAQIDRLNQFLSVFNLWVYQSEISLLEQTTETEKESSKGFDSRNRSSMPKEEVSLFTGDLPIFEHTSNPLNKSTSNTNSSLLSHSYGSKSSKPNQTTNTFRISKIEEIDYREEMNILSRCMIEIQSNRVYPVVLVCLPMLKELDKRMRAKKRRRRRSLLSLERGQNLDGNLGSDGIFDGNRLVVESLRRIGSVWEVEGLRDETKFITKLEGVGTRSIDWEMVVQQICHSSKILRDQSCLDSNELKEILDRSDWNFEEESTRLEKVGSQKRSTSRRESFISVGTRYNRTPSPTNFIKPLVSKSPGAVETPSKETSPLSSKQFNSSLKNNNNSNNRVKSLNHQQELKHHSQLVSSLDRHLVKSSSSSPSPSVTDLRESLLNKGFRINSKRRLSGSLFNGGSSHNNSSINNRNNKNFLSSNDLNEPMTSTSSLNNHSFNNVSSSRRTSNTTTLIMNKNLRSSTYFFESANRSSNKAFNNNHKENESEEKNGRGGLIGSSHKDENTKRSNSRSHKNNNNNNNNNCDREGYFNENENGSGSGSFRSKSESNGDLLRRRVLVSEVLEKVKDRSERILKKGQETREDERLDPTKGEDRDDGHVKSYREGEDSDVNGARDGEEGLKKVGSGIKGLDKTMSKIIRIAPPYDDDDDDN
ncbi:expressed protein [Phakopsora pachyrhizi]|uniref:Expressed protein n=1 Tax=Phakopsora pachyrhizi TaxID=170000 RepID=A0AAV0AIM7_PHAPC|nr:expressed protein [Phakopsora pachyrhizi]